MGVVWQMHPLASRSLAVSIDREAHRASLVAIGANALPSVGRNGATPKLECGLLVHHAKHTCEATIVRI